MISRRLASLFLFLPLLLLALFPGHLLARPHARTAKKLTHVSKARPKPSLSKREAKSTKTRHSSRIDALPISAKRNRRSLPLAKPVSRRSKLTHYRPEKRYVVRQVAKEIARSTPAPLLVKARPSPETAISGVSHPPDLGDLSTVASPDAASTPQPVVSVIRKTSEAPQLLPTEEVAATPEILPSLYNKRGRLVMPPPMKGSHEILLHQNEVADRDGVQRVLDDGDLEEMRHLGKLVSLPVSSGMQVDERLPSNRRYCRPWTAQFLATLARAHYARFHSPLQINSAVRTVEVQQHLIRVNGNAAPAEGETASPHLTGQAVDIAKRGLSLSEIAWLRGYLLPLVQEGKIDVEEEFQQSCFHISVYKRYLPSYAGPRRAIATTHREGITGLAIAMP